MVFKKSKKALKPKPLSQELSEEEQAEQFWEEVDHLAQEKIYQLLTSNIPFQNLKLITEPYTYEDKQQKLTGLFLPRDADYRTLLADIENQYSEEELPSPEVLAEEIALYYYRLVFKALINDLSEFASFDSSYFESLED